MNEKIWMYNQNNKVKNGSTFKYLVVTMTTNGKSALDITNQTGQGKKVFAQLNSLLQSHKEKEGLAIQINCKECYCIWG